MKLKKVQVAGECAAARCKARAEGEGGLCAKHAGAEAADIAPGDALALELEPQRTSAEKALALLASAPLDTQAQLDWLGAARGEVTRQLDALEQRRTSVTKPLNEAKRQVDALFRPVRETLEACKRCINDRLLQHATAARAAQDAALAQVELGARDASVLVVAHGGGAPSLPSNVTERRAWGFRVTDLRNVPREYLCIDERAVKEAIRTGAREIPGLEIFEELSIVGRA